MRNLCVIALVCAALAPAQQLVTRTVRLANIGNPSGLQEAATVLHYVCNTSGVSVDEASSSISFTDTPEAAALAEWALSAIDAGGPMAVQEYGVAGGGDDTVKVVYLTNTNWQQGIQEMLTQLRTVLELGKVFNVYGPRAVVFRGNSALIAAGTWLIAQLDKPFDAHASPASYQLAGAPDGNCVRVYYLHNIAAPKPTQELLSALRTGTKTGHVFVSNAPRAVAMRGTSDQIAQADAIVARLDVPSAN